MGTGKNSVPKCYRKHLSDRNKALESLYKESAIKFDVEGKASEENRHIVWAIAAELL